VFLFVGFASRRRAVGRATLEGLQGAISAFVVFDGLSFHCHKTRNDDLRKPSMLLKKSISLPSGATEERVREIESARFLWVAALTIAVSVVAVLAVRAAVVRVLYPNPNYAPLTLGPPIIDTILCTIVAIFVFLKVSSYPNGVRLWSYVATATLVLSFIPDVYWRCPATWVGAGRRPAVS
jgi:uncharacterized membrane protein